VTEKKAPDLLKVRGFSLGRTHPRLNIYPQTTSFFLKLDWFAENGHALAISAVSD